MRSEELSEVVEVESQEIGGTRDGEDGEVAVMFLSTEG